MLASDWGRGGDGKFFKTSLFGAVAVHLAAVAVLVNLQAPEKPRNKVAAEESQQVVVTVSRPRVEKVSVSAEVKLPEKKIVEKSSALKPVPAVPSAEKKKPPPESALPKKISRKNTREVFPAVPSSSTAPKVAADKVAESGSETADVTPVEQSNRSASFSNTQSGAGSGDGTELEYAGAPLNNPAVTYPRAALMRRLTGKVVVRLKVQADGTPVDLSIEKSSGHPLLDEEALKAAGRFRFPPFKAESGAKLPVFRKTYSFKL